MKNRFHLIAVIFFFCFIKQDAIYSQQVVFSKLPPPEESRWGIVLGITQDKQGYMWFACTQGLYRYNGYNIVAYKHNPLKANSLSSDYLECIFVDHNDIIWLGHRTTGLDRFDP